MINIAIDGPSGAGKSSAAKLTAARLGYVYVDTGALYRAIGVAMLRRGIETTDAEKVVAALPELDIGLTFVEGEQHVILNGEDVSKEIRLPEASMAASDVSAMAQVREYLLDLQHKLAAENNCLMDGRDIGTVILPNAQLKIFLTASAEIRAKRRYDELIGRGTPVEYDEVLKDIIQRDYNDSHREVAPLKPADDAVILDSSYLTLEEVVDRISAMIREVEAKEAAAGETEGT